MNPIKQATEEQLQEIHDFHMSLIAKKYDEIDSARNTINEVFTERARCMILEEERK